MENEELRKKILEFLETSSIPKGEKETVRIFLPLMNTVNLQKTYDILLNERQKMTKLGERQKRVEFKYKMMVEKITEIELSKQKPKA